MYDLVGVLRIERHEGQRREPRLGFLLPQKRIEPADGVVAEGFHRPGTIQNHGNVGVVVFHRISPVYRIGR
jgi:hypothetical protein